jgi:hypothetical protein
MVLPSAPRVLLSAPECSPGLPGQALDNGGGGGGGFGRGLRKPSVTIVHEDALLSELCRGHSSERAFWAPELSLELWDSTSVASQERVSGYESNPSRSLQTATASDGVSAQTSKSGERGQDRCCDGEGVSKEGSAESRLRDGDQCLEGVVRSFFEMYAPDCIDEAQVMAKKHLGCWAALNEHLNDTHGADLLTPAFLRSLCLTDAEIAHVLGKADAVEWLPPPAGDDARDMLEPALDIFETESETPDLLTAPSPKGPPDGKGMGNSKDGPSGCLGPDIASSKDEPPGCLGMSSCMRSGRVEPLECLGPDSASSKDEPLEGMSSCMNVGTGLDSRLAHRAVLTECCSSQSGAAATRLSHRAVLPPRMYVFVFYFILLHKVLPVSSAWHAT